LKKVILNALPPARLDTPSAALSILKAFLVHHGIETELIYWNFLLEGLLPAFNRNTDAIHFDLLPYLYLVAGEYGDPIAQSKANAFIKSQLPYRDILNDNSDYLAGARQALDDAVSQELSRFPNDTTLLFGIPCKYEQWIPGLVLSGYIKKFFPSSKIVIGGLRNRQRAESIMSIGPHFDFAVWGEGEYPLLELARLLDADNADFGRIPRLVFRDGRSLSCSGRDKGSFYDLNSKIFPDFSDYFHYLV
jgi:hypothetical protein